MAMTYNPQSIKKLRTDRDLTLEGFARAVGLDVTRQAVWRWENGHLPKQTSLMAIAEAFSVPLEYFFADCYYNGNKEKPAMSDDTAENTGPHSH